MKNSSPRF